MEYMESSKVMLEMKTLVSEIVVVIQDTLV